MQVLHSIVFFLMIWTQNYSDFPAIFIRWTQWEVWWQALDLSEIELMIKERSCKILVISLRIIRVSAIAWILWPLLLLIVLLLWIGLPLLGIRIIGISRLWFPDFRRNQLAKNCSSLATTPGKLGNIAIDVEGVVAAVVSIGHFLTEDSSKKKKDTKRVRVENLAAFMGLLPSCFPHKQPGGFRIVEDPCTISPNQPRPAVHHQTKPYSSGRPIPLLKWR